MRTVDWHGDHIVIIDQTRLPGELVTIALRTADAVVDAIQRLAVRGAPAIGVTGGLGVALVAQTARSPEEVTHAAERIRAARPTAVNLGWAVDRVLARAQDGPGTMLIEALTMLEQDVHANRAMGERGADLLETLADGPFTLHTHCNAGGLACVEWGTALGLVRTVHERGRLQHVFADETRPLLQGARLTAWELEELGASYEILVDGAAPGVILSGRVDAVVVGADRVAANGDVANKVGTVSLALAAARADIPFLVVAPESTIDVETPDGSAIDIELRSPHEVLTFAGVSTAPPGARAYNPAFDVTPADLVTALVTDHRVIRTAEGERPDDARA